MKGLWWIMSLSVIGSLLASCSGNSAKQQAATPTPSQPVASRPAKVPAAATSPQLLPVPPVPPSLLPSVDIPQRLARTSTGQSDPFTPLPVTPATTAPLQANVSKTAQASSKATSANQSARPNTRPNTAKKPQVETTKSSQGATASNASTGSVASNSTASSKPAPPTTQLAEAVVVSGVVQTQGRVSAIVTAPNEPTSRTVKAGDYLSGGQIRVKQILTQGEPIVILEQNGVEVMKSVGYARAS